jgi:hypothetical protein
MPVIEYHSPFGIMVDMPVIEAQRASILVPHDHRHINHERVFSVWRPAYRHGTGRRSPLRTAREFY